MVQVDARRTIRRIKRETNQNAGLLGILQKLGVIDS